eukprot:TRINITY_DN9548_c0_g3_i2.p1 TRINITY_DN9548_c0_g3~~TRINITY_DN9548_c0_g3_i2.p1  ORF type:complete len:351 (+),score=97.91 TRINITY_DN9548_c0_g3_i2:1000-2052(+)
MDEILGLGVEWMLEMEREAQEYFDTTSDEEMMELLEDAKIDYILTFIRFFSRSQAYFSAPVYDQTLYPTFSSATAADRMLSYDPVCPPPLKAYDSRLEDEEYVQYQQRKHGSASADFHRLVRRALHEEDKKSRDSPWVHLERNKIKHEQLIEKFATLLDGYIRSLPRWRDEKLTESDDEDLLSSADELDSTDESSAGLSGDEIPEDDSVERWLRQLNEEEGGDPESQHSGSSSSDEDTSDEDASLWSEFNELFDGRPEGDSEVFVDDVKVVVEGPFPKSDLCLVEVDVASESELDDVLTPHDEVEFSEFEPLSLEFLEDKLAEQKEQELEEEDVNEAFVQRPVDISRDYW